MDQTELRESIITAAEAGDLREIHRLVADEHAANVADLMEDLDEDVRVLVFRSLADAVAGDVLDEIDDNIMAELLEAMDPEVSADIIEAMPSDDAAEVLTGIDERVKAQIMDRMEPEDVEPVRELLGHDEDSVGRLMATEVFALDQDLRPDEAIAYVRSVAEDVESIYYIYALGPDGRLTGVLSLRELLLAPADVRVRDIMRRDIVTVPAHADQEEAARVVAKYDLLAVPIVDDQNHLVGLFTVDDAMDVLESEAAEDMYALAGTSEESEFRRSSLSSAFARLPWLLVCLAGEMVSGSIIHRVEPYIVNLVQVAMFVPVVMAVGGNVGTQSLATTIRALAVGEFETLRAWRAIVKELSIGVIVGALCGAIAGAVAAHWWGNWGIGLVVFLAMLVSQTFAAASGTAFPLLFKALKRDPALASGPFITTLNDIIGLALYFGFALLILGVR